ncbi:hypothetical protein PENTCL1PPCAC_20815, partial [Pristionchus entomophagus]
PESRTMIRQKQNSLDISNMDNFSNLPADCILSVFSFMNQSELDAVDSASKTVHNYVNFSRRTAVRLKQFHTFDLFQVKTVRILCIL